MLPGTGPGALLLARFPAITPSLEGESFLVVVRARAVLYNERGRGRRNDTLAHRGTATGLTGTPALDAVWYGAEGAALELDSQTTTPPCEGVSFLSRGGPAVVRARRVEKRWEGQRPAPARHQSQGIMRGWLLLFSASVVGGSLSDEELVAERFGRGLSETGGGSGSSSSSSSGSGTDSGYTCTSIPLGPFNSTHTREYYCRYQSYNQLEALMTDYLTSTNQSAGSNDVHWAIVDQCNQECPAPAAGDRRQKCVTYTYHSVYSEWVHDTSAWGGLQWNIFFICISLILGSIMQWVFGASVPYTVGILIMYIIFGAVAETQTKGLDCPWHAWVYSEVNSHGGHYVAELTQDGWNKFICAGCDPAAFCIMGEAGTDFAGRRSCGDGSLDPPDCRWTFDELNSEFKVSSMLAESVKNMYATTLSADQLWRNECNLFRAMLGLADIDPHVLLVVFLPALLFESACFGVDFGIFKKQAVQICLLAFPAMICSSIITGLLIMATIPQWNLWVCWLIGIILSATDPVAVVALLKELGASKALGEWPRACR